jgi:WD40 repeat protein
VYFYDSLSLQASGVIPVAVPAAADSNSASKAFTDIRNSRYTVSRHRILALSFYPSGRFLAGSSNGIMYSWDIPPGKRVDNPLPGDAPELMAISPNAGNIAISRSSDPEISIVNANSGTLARTLSPFSEPARALAFSQDGAWLAGAGHDGSIIIWDTMTWQAKPALTGHRGAVMTLAFSRDSSLLASGGEDSIIRVWEVASGKLLSGLSGHRQSVSTVAFGAANDILASASSADSSVFLWKLGDSPIGKTLRGHSGSLRSLAFSPDGSNLAGAGDETICLWNTATGKMARVLAERTIPGRSRPLAGNAVRYVDVVTAIAYSPDGTVMVCGGMNNTLILWEAATWKSRVLR